MRTSTSCCLGCFLAFCAIFATGGIRAEDAPRTFKLEVTPTTQPVEATAEYELEILLSASEPTVRASYMGVGVDVPGEALRSQLKLPEGTGLVVNWVDDAGPSKGALRIHDVLQKFDDQLLVNADQLVTLVRLHKSGENISILLVREARPMTVSLKLAEKDAVPLKNYLNLHSVNTVPMGYELAYTNGYTFSRPAEARLAPTTQPNRWVKAALLSTTQPSTLAPNIAGELLVLSGPVDGEIVTRATRSGPVSIDDGEVLMWLRPVDGGTELLVLERSTGKSLFKGPIDSAEQWKAVPESVRQKFENWRDAMQRASHAPAEKK